ncbi:MAG: ABC transporter substrate-binding protein, partial [Pseudomonas caspiana]
MMVLLRTGVIGCLALLLMIFNTIAWADSEPAVSTPLSAEQRAWLAKRGPLRVGLVMQAPYAQLDRRQQQLSGANVDLMNLLGRSLQTELLWRNFPDQAALEEA